MTVTIYPGRAVGTVPAPPSKSCAHRMLLCGRSSTIYFFSIRLNTS